MNIKAVSIGNKNQGLDGREISLDKLNILDNFKMGTDMVMASLAMVKIDKM
jgi:hypothetical protein